VGEALGGELGSGGVVGSDAAGELGAGEHGVVGVGCVVSVEPGVSGVGVACVTVELLLGVGVRAEDGAERLERTLGTELGVKVVEDREVDQGLGREVEAEVGLGAQVEEVELQVHSDDGAGVPEPGGEVPSVGLEVELEDEGGPGNKEFQLNIGTGHSD
jgi:hypothetical protein